MKRRFVAWTCLLIISLLIPSLGWTDAMNAQIALTNDAAPIVVQHTPGSGEEVLLDQFVEVTFDRAMDHVGVERAFSLSPTAVGRFEWPDERTVRFLPDRPLERDVEYTVRITTEAVDRDGVALQEDYTFRFRTLGYLQVMQVIPAPDSADVEVESDITVMFSRPVVPLTALAQQADLPQPLTFDPPVEGQGEWLNTSVYLFKPDRPFAGGMAYRVTVGAGLVDNLGNILDEDYVWEFFTQPPQVVWLSPKDEQEQTAVDTAISVRFNQAVSCQSVEKAFVLTKQGSDVPVKGEISCSGQYFGFQPLEMLEFDAIYEARLSPEVIAQAGGLEMREGRSWRFRTVPLPRIVRTTPSDGERNASPHKSFVIKFNTAIDPDTVMSNLKFTPPIDVTQVYTSFNTWDLSFSVDFGAQPSSDYQVDIGPDIQDPYGNKTGQAMTVRFRTAPLKPQAQLLAPGQISTANANDPVSLFVRHVNTGKLTFRLYRLNLQEMAAALDDWWDYGPPRRSQVRKWTVNVDSAENEWQTQPVKLNEKDQSLTPGIYLITMDAAGVKDRYGYQRHLVLVSPVNLTIKNDREKALVWATDMDSGKPVEGLSLRLLNYDLQLGGEGRTQADGLASFDLTGVDRSDFYVFSDAPFVLGSTRWSQGISGRAFGYDGNYGYHGPRSHLYTDRPIYRAGQTVYFKGVFRNENDVAYSMPTSRQVSVRAWDPAGEEVLTAELELDEFGTFYGELPLKPDAALGDYNLRARFENQSFLVGFQVAAYRPPEFQVEVEPEVSEIAAGERISATVNVSYFFGGPVSGIPVNWNILARQFRYESTQFSRYSFSDSNDPWICFDCWWRPPQPPTPALSGNGWTDGKGELLIEIPGNISQLAAGQEDVSSGQIVGSKELIIEATASGNDGTVISGRNKMVVHQGAFYIGLAPRQVVGHAGKEMGVDVVTVDWHDNVVPNQPLNVEIYRREWLNTFVEDESGSGRWEWETKDELVDTSQINTDANGQATVTFTPEEGGSFRIVVNGRDDAERLVQSSLFVWVSSPAPISWRRENNDRIDLIADKTTYQVGETAEILIPSPFEGKQWALITVERGGILYREVVEMSNNSYVYRLPIDVEHIPNVYISAVLIKGKDATNKVTSYKVGYTVLNVDIAPVKLNIAVVPAEDRTEPGSPVDLKIRVTDETGEPVEAALSLDVVDKAVLSLSPRETDAIVDAFYGRRGLGVGTASGLNISLNRLLLEQLEQYQVEAAARGELMGDADASDAMMYMSAAPMPAATAVQREAAAPQPPAGVAVREEFADTAYWNPTVVTDRSGQATVSMKVPDNLTTWAIRGVGLTKDTRVGEGMADLLVTKPLLIRPVTPRFFVVDDRARLAALVSNNTEEARDVEVILSSTGLELLDPAQQHIRIEAESEAEIAWNATVTDVPNVEVIFSAVSGDYADAAKPRLTTGPEGTLMVHRYTAPDIVGTAGQLESAGSRTEVMALPPRYDDRKGALNVRLDPSLAAGMQDGLTYLEHFPYECSEQLASKFLPNILTYRALAELGIRNEELETKLSDLVKGALDKLYIRQREDGGWGWWSTGESNPQISAYIVFAMHKAIENDFEVNSESFERGLQYLRSQLIAVDAIKSQREANLQAFLLYVLTDSPGNADKFTERVDDLFENREKLSHFGKAFLAMTIGRANPQDKVLKTLLSDLQNSAILSATGAHWEEKDYDRWAMNTDTRSTAIILDALTKLDPGNALNPNVVRWLMVARKDGIWESTQETAWALMALTDWMVMTGELKGEYNYLVNLNGQEKLSGAVDLTNIREQTRLTVQIAELLRDQGNRLTISRGEGPGRLYYAAHLNVYLPVEEIEPTDRGISVVREYTLPGCNFGDECAEVNEAQVGDTVQVRLTITVPHDRYYVIVEDPLPAGAEGIDTGLDTTSLLERDPTLARLTDKGLPYEYFYRWWWNWYTRTEMRDDKVVLFADYLPAGTYQYIYTFRAYIPGEYQVIPTIASEMYFPEVFGRSAGRLFTVK